MTTRQPIVAAITGAGSGIGRAVALELAGKGVRLALSDVDEASLDTTRVRAEARGAETRTRVVDVADRASVAAWAQDTVGHFGVVNQLYNIAGVAGGGRRLVDVTYEDIERVLDINLWGVIHGTKEFLPHLIASCKGTLVNVSSLNGFLAQPSLAPYCASKFAVRTRFYNEKLFRTTAEQAARTIVDGVAAGQARILVGSDAKQVDAIVRLAPARAIRRAVSFERLMTQRRG
ncbi:SDR family oxidoreductase [Arsenicicoccus piscis]|uniref:Acetoin dehydrogenase n=1 Tax=Arsenicicoccus piscis TaxID=673954 RepID=A0ABQ6HVE8_9MICO|nr:SDR family oxidoreductase [Arsenicicoccus piscis]MCH8627492.1 SDR family oxidoreductase [Arsenicicoccus piscis]GMA21668.1 acetoin dehydrogenase [Arsenicicoccus piscis]